VKPTLCLVGGELVAPEAARISPFDRGFLFGDAVYEGFKVVDGRALFVARHLERLARSLAKLRIPRPEGLADELARLLDASGVASGFLYLQVSRGATVGRSHLPPPGLAPTVFAFVAEHAFADDPTTLPGLAAVSRADDRWAHRDVKSTAIPASVLGKLDAAATGADETLFVGADGTLREGGNTSLFARDTDGWHTHATGPEILPSVTRALLLELARDEGLPVAERAPRLAARADWAEAFVCGTVTGVRGLVRLDGETVSDGAVGEGTRRFAALLAAAERREAAR